MYQLLFYSIHLKPFCSRRRCRLPLSLYSWHCVCHAYYCALLHYAVCCTLCCPAVLRCTTLRCTYHASLCFFLLRCFFGFFASHLRYILVVVLSTVLYLMLCCIFCRIECAMLRCILAFCRVESSAVLCWAMLCALLRSASLCFSVFLCASLCLAALRCASLRFAAYALSTACLLHYACLLLICCTQCLQESSGLFIFCFFVFVFCFCFFGTAELAWCWRLRKHCPRTCWTISVYGYTHGWALVYIYI